MGTVQGEDPAAGDQETADQFDVVVIGAGVLGLYALYRSRQLGLRTRAYEEAPGVGGTWYWNRYPGCRFDTPSPIYSYSFSDEFLEEWDWREMYSSQPDNERYCNFFADRFDLRRDIQLNCRVESLVWNEAKTRWTVTLADGQQSTARFVIAAVGKFSTKYVPEYRGLDDFKGVWVHTGRWPEEGVELEGKQVAVIGTGSTAVQVIPEVAKVASKVVVLQRTATYCVPLRNRPISPDEMQAIKAGYRDLFRQLEERDIGGDLYAPHPQSAYEFSKEERYALYEKAWEIGRAGMATVYRECFRPGEMNDEYSEWLKDKIRERVKDPILAEKLLPKDHKIGQRRVPGEDGYYEAFNRDNIELVDLKEDPIERITVTGIKTKAHEFDLDVIILATGWDYVTGSLLGMDIHGIGGVTLKEKFGNAISAYLHLMSVGFPNLYLVPPTTTGQSVRSGEPLIEWVCQQICYALQKGATRIEPTEEAEESWMLYAIEKAKNSMMAQAGSYVVGANIPGKARTPFSIVFESEKAIRKRRAEIAANDYTGFRISQ